MARRSRAARRRWCADGARRRGRPASALPGGSAHDAGRGHPRRRAAHPRPAAYGGTHRAAPTSWRGSTTTAGARRYRLAYRHGSTTGCCPARRWCGPPSTATSSTPTATRRREPLSGPEHHRACARSPISTARRSGTRARSRTPRRSPRGGATSTRPIMRRLPPRSSGCEAGTASPSSTTATRSARASRSCSRACCRTSTSAPTTARPARRRSRRAVAGVCAAQTGYTSVLNGRFKGGWTTRHYGRPETGSTRSRWSSRSPPTCDRGAALCLRRGEGRTRLRAHLARHPRDARATRASPIPRSMTMTDPRHNIRDVYPPTGTEITRQELADRSAAADADEQPRTRTWPRTRMSWWSMAASAGRRGPGRISTASSRR